MFRHVFLYKVAAGADPKKTVEILNALPAKVPGVRTWTLGQHQPPPGASGGRWDAVWFATSIPSTGCRHTPATRPT
jgi:hypothetical protein